MLGLFTQPNNWCKMNYEEMLALHDSGFFKEIQSRRKAPAVFSVVFNTSTEDSLVTNLMAGPCHGSTQSLAQQHTASEILGVVTKTKGDFINKPGVIQLYDWIINRSVFAEAFPLKDIESNLWNGIIVQPNVPTPIFLGALQLSRMTNSELSKTIEVTGRILEADLGFDPLTLLALVHAFGISIENGMIVSEIGSYLKDSVAAGSFFVRSSDHSPFSLSGMSEGMLVSLLSGTDKLSDQASKKLNESSMKTFAEERRWTHRRNQNFVVLGPQSVRGSTFISEFVGSLLAGTPTMLNGTQSLFKEYNNKFKLGVERFLAKQPNQPKTIGVNLIGMKTFCDRVSA